MSAFLTAYFIILSAIFVISSAVVVSKFLQLDALSDYYLLEGKKLGRLVRKTLHIYLLNAISSGALILYMWAVAR